MADQQSPGESAFDAVAQSAAQHGGGTSSSDLRAYGQAGGAAGGAAACVALGVTAAAAPLCGAIGGAVGGFIVGIGQSIFGGASTDPVPGIMQHAFIRAVQAAQDAVGERPEAGGNVAANEEIANAANAAAVARRKRYTAVHQASTGGKDWFGTGGPNGAGVQWWGRNGLRASGLDMFRWIAGQGPTAAALAPWEGKSAQTSDLANAIIAYVSARPAAAEAVERARSAPGPDRAGGAGSTSGGPGVGTFATVALVVAAIWKRREIAAFVKRHRR